MASAQESFSSTDQIDIQLWLLVITVMVLDILLTLYGLNNGLIEYNPIVLFGLQTFGYAVLAFLKVPAILLGLIGWVCLSKQMRRLNLIGLAIPWKAAVVLNTWLILSL